MEKFKCFLCGKSYKLEYSGSVSDDMRKYGTPAFIPGFKDNYHINCRCHPKVSLLVYKFDEDKKLKVIKVFLPKNFESDIQYIIFINYKGNKTIFNYTKNGKFERLFIIPKILGILQSIDKANKLLAFT